MPHETEAEPATAVALGIEAGALAHDLNNLLAALILNLESLEPLLEPGGEAAELVAGCLDAAAQGSELVRRLFGVAARLPGAARR